MYPQPGIFSFHLFCWEAVSGSGKKVLNWGPGLDFFFFFQLPGGETLSYFTSSGK